MCACRTTQSSGGSSVGLAPRWSPPLLLQWPLSPPRARTPLEFGCSRQFHTGGCYSFDCPASQVKRRPSAARLLPAPTQMALCLRLCLLRLLRRELLGAFETLDDSTPQRRISELRVWSYEPFIVFAPSSSGYTSGQNLKVLCILTLSPTALGPIGHRVFKGIQLKA